MAIQSQPSRISEPFAGSGTKNVIPSTNATPSASQAASWASGFPPECSQPISAGGCPVPRNDVNGVLNQLSQDYSFRQDGGVWEWSALADYDVQRMVRGSDGLLYYSKAQSGPGVVAGAQDPTLDTAHDYWDQVPTDNENVVHITGNEKIFGEKSFAQPLRVRNDEYDFSTTPSIAVGNNVYFTDKNNVEFAGVKGGVDTDKMVFVSIDALNPDAIDNTKTSLWVHLTTGGTRRVGMTADQVRPTGGIFPTLGLAGTYRWGQIYSTNASISTSDERQKQDICGLPDAVLDAWGEVGFLQYRMRDAVAKKGTAARLHTGLVAQRIKAVFDAAGLSAADYGFFCHDEWESAPATGEDPAVEAGDEYSLRYEEALCMEAAYQRRRADRAEARLAALEERLAAIEAKLLNS